MRIIEREDMQILRDMAKKYNLNLADFGRAMIRQSERSIGRGVRLTEEEYNYVRKTAAENNMTAARFLALACHAFANETDRTIPVEYRLERGKRVKRLEARIYNNADEAVIVKTATEYSMKISALIRFCVMHFDGKKIHLKGENKHSNEEEERNSED